MPRTSTITSIAIVTSPGNEMYLRCDLRKACASALWLLWALPYMRLPHVYLALIAARSSVRTSLCRIAMRTRRSFPAHPLSVVLVLPPLWPWRLPRAIGMLFIISYRSVVTRRFSRCPVFRPKLVVRVNLVHARRDTYPLSICTNLPAAHEEHGSSAISHLL